MALPGQLTFFGDKLAGLPSDRVKILQQTLPVADVHPVSLYPYFRMLPVWNLSVNHERLGRYNVVAFFNWGDEAVTISVTPAELGIPDVDYTGFEFWEQRVFSYKVTDKQLSLEVPPHGVRVVAIHPPRDIPQWVGSDRHIAQNGMEVVDMGWDPKQKRLRGTIRLVGSFPLTLFFRVPSPYRLERVACKDASCRAEQKGDLLVITLQRTKSAQTDFGILFSAS